MAAGISLYGGCSDDNPVASTPISEEPPFPFLEVSGTHYEVGKKIGLHFKSLIDENFRRQNVLIDAIYNLVESDPVKYYNPFYNAALENYPDFIDELKGMADGSGSDFKKLMATNFMMEIITRYRSSGNRLSTKAPHFGCSDISYSSPSKTLMAHNEDNNKAFNDLMYVARVNIPGKPSFIGVNYPGLIFGIPPTMNEAGIVTTGNYIGPTHVNDGIPWSFLARAVMEKSNLSDAVAALKNPNVALAEHYQVGSFSENKIVSVEYCNDINESKDLSGFYVHTNHLILPSMKDIPQDLDSTTIARFNVLTSYANEYENKIGEVDPDKMISWLSNHEGYPHSLCAHGDAATIVSTVFDFQDKSWRLYRGNPCLGHYKTIRM